MVPVTLSERERGEGGREGGREGGLVPVTLSEREREEGGREGKGVISSLTLSSSSSSSMRGLRRVSICWNLLFISLW